MDTTDPVAKRDIGCIIFGDDSFIWIDKERAETYAGKISNDFSKGQYKYMYTVATVKWGS